MMQEVWAIGAAVARFPDTEEVTGSIPVSPTKNPHLVRLVFHVDIAQLVERDLAKVEVASSNLVVHSEELDLNSMEEGSLFFVLSPWKGTAVPE